MNNQSAINAQEEQQPVYLIVFAILAIFTALEVGSSYLTDLPEAIKIGLLVFLAAIKVALVLLYFMHLRFDSRIFAMPVALGLVLIIPLLLIVTLTTRASGSNSAQSASASSGGGQSQTVNVTEESYNIALSTNSVPAGLVTFHITNNASDMPHELLVIKTDRAADNLPTDNSGNVDEGSVTVVKKAENIAPGTSTDITADLQAGHYVLICNIPGHYSQGMRVELNVGGGSGSNQSSTSTSPSSTAESTPPSDNTSSIMVTQDTFSIALSADTVPAGPVTFQVENVANELPHTLWIIQTDQSADSLPTGENGDLMENELNIVGSIDQISPGASQQLTLNLQSGHYALVCHIPNHFHEGEYADLIVSNGTGTDATPESTAEATPQEPAATEDVSG